MTIQVKFQERFLERFQGELLTHLFLKEDLRMTVVLIVIAVYMLAMLYIGYRAKKSVNSSADFSSEAAVSALF